MLMGFLYLGGSAMASGNKAVGALSIGYGATGVVSYLGFSLSPIFRLLNVNAVSGIGVALGFGAMFTGGLDLTLLMLTALHIVDLVAATKEEIKKEDLDGEYTSVDSTE